MLLILLFLFIEGCASTSKKLSDIDRIYAALCDNIISLDKSVDSLIVSHRKYTDHDNLIATIKLDINKQTSIVADGRNSEYNAKIHYDKCVKEKQVYIDNATSSNQYLNMSDETLWYYAMELFLNENYTASSNAFLSYRERSSTPEKNKLLALGMIAQCFMKIDDKRKMTWALLAIDEDFAEKTAGILRVRELLEKSLTTDYVEKAARAANIASKAENNYEKTRCKTIDEEARLRVLQNNLKIALSELDRQRINNENAHKSCNALRKSILATLATAKKRNMWLQNYSMSNKSSSDARQKARDMRTQISYAKTLLNKDMERYIIK